MSFRFASLIAVVFLACAVWAQSPPATQNSGAVPGTGAGVVENSAATRNLAIDDCFRILEIEDAQLSPEGKWVAYVVKTPDLKEDKNESRIWMVPTSGGPAIPLTAEGVSCDHPRWSPDGKYLGFLSGRAGPKGEKEDEDSKREELWILNREGGEAQKITDTIQSVNSFSWSPAGDRIVLILQDPSISEIEAAKNRFGRPRFSWHLVAIPVRAGRALS